MTWQVWLKGLIAAAISAGANAITATIVAPSAFNFGAQWKQTVTLTLVNGVVAAAAYLAKSPIPATNEGTK